MNSLCIRFKKGTLYFFFEKMSQFSDSRKQELEKMRKDLGPLGGAGHYFDIDAAKSDCPLSSLSSRIGMRARIRDAMKDEEIRNVLKLLSLGERRINLKGLAFINLNK